MNVVMQQEKRRFQLLSDPCRSRPVSRARGDVLRGEGESRANNMMYLTRSRQKQIRRFIQSRIRRSHLTEESLSRSCVVLHFSTSAEHGVSVASEVQCVLRIFFIHSFTRLVR